MNDTPTPINSFVAEIRNGVAVAPKREVAALPSAPPVYRVAVKHKDSDSAVIADSLDRGKLLDLADQFTRMDPKYAFVSLVAVS